MASLIYPKGLEAFLNGSINWASDTIKAALVKTAYTYSSAHDFYDDVSTNVLGTPQTIGSKTTTSGVADGADVTFTALTGTAVSYILIYKDTGTPSTSPLIALIDDYTGLPLTPDGTNVTVAWPNDSNKIFKL